LDLLAQSDGLDRSAQSKLRDVFAMIRDKNCLVEWNGDWFNAITTIGLKNCERRLQLFGCGDKRLEQLGFQTQKHTKVPAYFRFFKSDPGFIYYPVIKLWGHEVVFCGVKPENCQPRKIKIMWGHIVNLLGPKSGMHP